MHLSRPARLPVRALQLAALAAALLAAAAPLRADDSGLYRGVGPSVAVLESASAGGSLLRSPPDTRPIPPAPEHLVATSLSGGSQLGPGLDLEGARASFATGMPARDTLVGDAAERAAVWSVSSVGSVPLDSSLSLFARFGLHYPEGQKQIPSAVQVDQLGRVYGLGLHFAPNERVDLRAEVQHFTRVGSDGSSDTSAMLLGAQFRF